MSTPHHNGTNPRADDPWTIDMRRVVPLLVSVGAGAGAFAALSAVAQVRFPWGLFRPVDAVGAWTSVAAAASTLSALTAIVLSVVAYRGLRSIKLTRTDMLNRAQREAKLSAIQRLEELAKEVIPMNGPILDAMAAANVKVFVAHSADVKFDPDPADLRRVNEWIDALPPGTHNRILAFLNRLEAWSTYFTTGVADGSVAFGPAAPLLRAWVGQYYPALLQSRAQNQRSGTYPNLVMLYTVWSNEMDDRALANLHKDLVAQLEHRQSIGSKVQLPDPIGTTID